jgi:oligopeptidase B
VLYVEPAKWVAKLRRVRAPSPSVLLKTELGAGHGGPSGRYDAWRDRAFALAWVIDTVGASHEPLP